MKLENLRTLIRESINEYIKEIDEAGTRAMYEAKMTACDKAINERKQKIEMAESLEEMQGMFDETKMGELKKEIKMLEKQKAKYGKMLEKMNKAKKSAPKDEKEVTTDAPIDETDVMAEMDVTEETTEEALNESFLKMQKLAGVITEAQYNQRKSLIENQLNEEKKFTEILGMNGYHLMITDKMEQDIKNQLGLGDEDIKFGYNEEQGNRFYWWATININLEALPEDKKSSYNDIIMKIVRPGKTDEKATVPTNSPKTTKPSGFFNKLKSSFSK